MKATTTTNTQVAEQDAVHPMKKSHMLISSKHVDLENLNAIESVSMTLALVLAVTVGLLQSITLS